MHKDRKQTMTIKQDCFVTVYHDYLQGIISKHGNRSPKKTQAQLKAAMVRLLDSTGYHNTRISNICEEAKLAKGTFYTRFDDKQDLIVEILQEYAQIQIQVMPDISASLEPFQLMHRFNYWFALTFKENAGIHRTLMQLSEIMPSVSAIWDNYLHHMTRTYAHILGENTSEKIDKSLETVIVFSLGGMLDQALYAIYATHRSDLYESSSEDIDHLVETITLLQYRALLVCNPNASELPTTQDMLSIKK